MTAVDQKFAAANISFSEWKTNGFVLYPRVNKSGTLVAAYRSGYLAIYPVSESGQLGSAIWDSFDKMPGYYLSSFDWLGDDLAVSRVSNGGSPASTSEQVERAVSSPGDTVIVNPRSGEVKGLFPKAYRTLSSANDHVLCTKNVTDSTEDKNKAEVWDCTSFPAKKIATFVSPQNNMESVSWSPDGEYFYFITRVSRFNKFHDENEEVPTLMRAKIGFNEEVISPQNAWVDGKYVVPGENGMVNFVSAYFGRNPYIANYSTDGYKEVPLKSVQNSLSKNFKKTDLISISPNGRFIVLQESFGMESFKRGSVVIFDLVQQKFTELKDIPHILRAVQWCDRGLIVFTMTNQNDDEDASIKYGMVNFLPGVMPLSSPSFDETMKDALWMSPDTAELKSQ